MPSIFQHYRARKAREAVRTRRETREHFTRAIGELAVLATAAIDQPGFENRSAYVRNCLTMIVDKVDRLRELK